MINLKSSIIKKGKYVSQILHFVGGEKRTFNNVDTESKLRNQFMALQKSIQSTYVPDLNSSLYEKYIFFAAINYEKMSLNGGSSGSKEKAIEIYKNIVLKNSGSEFINEAKMGLTRLNWHDN